VADIDSLARLTAAVTPAVMVSACGLLALGLDNQAARMTGRLREIAREYRATTDEQRARHLKTETQVLSRRHGYYTVALLANYSALLSFLVSSAAGLTFGSSGHTAVLVLFGVGVGFLALMAICTLSSVRLSRASIVVEELEVLRERDAPPSKQ
jgi:hypothetical protein